MIESIHQSSLGTFLRCGEQGRRRYIEDEIIPPGIAAGRGTGVHKANKVNLRNKIKTKQDMPLSDLQDAARDGFIHSFDNGIFLPKEDIPHKKTILNDGLNDTLRLTKLYRNEVAPNAKPVAVEEKFKIDVGLPLFLSGTIDYEEIAVINDLKTTTKSWSNGKIDSEIQPIFYSFVHEHETGIRPEFFYHILVALKKSEKLQQQSITPTKKHYRALFAKLALFCKMLETGLFPPANPSAWWCSEKWCGYYLTCKYVGN